jgi:hypothetical protein
LFYGFQIELDQIHQRLSNQKKRAMGSCAVVLWGPPGSGKTHLAREYLWRHRNDFPSGIFWIDCKSEESIYKSFWEIAQAAALLGAADRSERGRDWDGATTFVEAVRKWFESKEGWLIVFDGVTFDSENEVLAFMKFIPDSKGNSIIFTSVDRTLAKRQRLLYPAAVKVSPLSVDDARRLLYKGLDIKNPTSAQEAKATELVKYYECLPLAIHAAGHVLTAKGKALEKFHVRSYPTSKRLAEPYAEIMQDLRENFHHEAISLINILGFFGHSVPVAMLQLGRRALKGFNVEIRSIDREGSTRRDLETTIATLIKYGMVERTLRCYNVERTDSLQSQPSLITTGGDSSPELTQGSIREDAIAKRPESSLESSSTRSTTYSIDILQVHTVVQGSCRDELRLKDKEMYWWWLIVAVELFRLSYFSADERIRAPGGQGLVRDYREYETHAVTLYSHFPKDKHAASINVQKARHELRKVIRAIKREIENRSPLQSFRSARQEVQISIFEHTSSTSSDGPDTPMSTPSRSSTWALEDVQSKSESPTQIENGYRQIISGAAESGDVSSEEDHGYLSGFDDSLVSSILTERRRSIPELLTASSAEDPARPHDGPSSRRSSFLQAIFKGHAVKPKHKDLGDWRPVPAPPSLTHTDVKTTASSRASSSDDHRPISASSQAEAALAAVHRFSPPASRGGQIKSPNQPTTAEPQDKENLKQPFGMKSPSLTLSPLASEFDPNQTLYPRKSTPSTSHHSRSLTTSPPLLQIPPVKKTNLSNQSVPTLPIEENISFTRRIPPFNMPRALPLSQNFNMTQSDVLPMPPPYLPTGYASQPMSRDGSRESSHSLATAPAGPGATSLSPPSTYSYLRRAPPISTDAVAESYPSNHLSRIGDWAATSTSPTGLTPLAPAISLDGAGPGVVQFGSASPVNLYEARNRADEHARRLLLFEKGAFRPNGARATANAGVQRASNNDNEAGVQGLGLEFT